MSLWDTTLSRCEFTLKLWAERHDTSIEICQAIAEQVDSFYDMFLVWDDATTEREIDVLTRAWEIAPVGTKMLRWGDRFIPREQI